MLIDIVENIAKMEIIVHKYWFFVWLIHDISIIFHIFLYIP